MEFSSALTETEGNGMERVSFVSPSPLASKPSEAGLMRQRKKEGADMEFSSALSETEGNGMERVSSDVSPRVR